MPCSGCKAQRGGSCPRADRKSELLGLEPILLVQEPGRTPRGRGRRRVGAGPGPWPCYFAERGVGGGFGLAPPPAEGTCLTLWAPGRRRKSDECFLFSGLRGRWGKAGGCETKLSPQTPWGGTGKPVSWRRPRSWGQKTTFWAPLSTPIPAQSRHTPE